MYFPSLYFSLDSNALSYFHPTVSRHCRQAMSRTTCRPVVILRSTASDWLVLTTPLKRYAFPCWPRKFCKEDGSSDRCVGRAEQATYPADDVIIVRKVCLALLAAKDLAGVQINVVGETHRGFVLPACWAGAGVK